MYRKLSLSVTSDTHIITANKRLAFHLQNLKLGITQESIETFDGWLLGLWTMLVTSHHKPYRLLSEAEQSYLWQQVISQSLDEYPLLQVNSTASLAQQAWQNLRLWQKPPQELDLNSGIEVEQFVFWANSFEALCQDQHLICPIELPLKILEEPGKLQLPKKLILVGFDELTPLHQYFLQKLGCQLNFFKTEEDKSRNLYRLAATTSNEEILLMARWAKACLLDKAGAQIACIVPELNSLRNQIERIFTEVFADTHLNFNISAGQALSQFKLIQNTLGILSLRANNNPWELISELLNSNYLNTNTENQLLSAETDRLLREKTHNQLVSLNTVKNILNSLNNDYPDSDLATRWESWQEQIAQAPSKALPSDWIEHFKSELALIGWAKQKTHNSQDNELLLHWEKALEELTQLDQLSGPINRSNALKLLRNITQSIIFQPKNKPSRLQILGVLEASGLNFTATWIMGLSDRNWPPAARPNPFIPHYQQRAWQMPHADHERELHYCLQIQERILTSADTIILSYAIEDHHQKQSASNLIRKIPEINIEQLLTLFKIEHYQTKAEQIFKKSLLEFTKDDQAPCLHPNENIPGGSFILKEQAICPFRAFAHIRLGAFSLEEPTLGLSPIKKGIFAHKALELFWKKIKDQEKLLELSEAELNTEIEKCVDQAIRKSDENPSLLKIERLRLIKLLHEWLDFEKRREPFQVVAEEAGFQTQIGNLSLNLRIDRIDQLADGSYLILDYKTGSPSIGSWFDERITEPQLPLYASFAFAKSEAIAFAQLKSNQMKLKGISASDKNQAGLTPLEKCRYELKSEKWPDLRTEWKTQLSKTADAFYEGKAAVDPHKTQLACEQCELQALCRINELNN